MGKASRRPDPSANTIDSRNVDLRQFYERYEKSQTSSERLAAASALQGELAKQQAAERTYQHLASLAYPGDEDSQKKLRRRVEMPNEEECETSVHAAIRVACADKFDANSGFALQFHQVVVNICADVARGLHFAVVEGARQACASTRQEV